MNRIKLLLLLLVPAMLSGCDLIRNSLHAKDATEELMETLLKEDYDKCLTLFSMEHELSKDVDPESLKPGLVQFRSRVIDNFGTQLAYSFMNSEKQFSTVEGKSTPPNTTRAFIQFANDTHFGVLVVLLDDANGKILNINTLNVKKPIPNMLKFWLFGLIVICVPAFNIYVIRLIRRSNRKRKWLKYLAVIALNTPAITYTALGVFSFKLLNFQVMLGFGISLMGYMNTQWTLGIPLGGLYWLWRLKQKEDESPEPMKQGDITNLPLDSPT
jgi:hypothetical protein